MLRLAVYPNERKPEAGALLERILCFFAERDVRLMIPADKAERYHCREFSVEDIESLPTDIALSIGGDGTLLGVCHRYRTRQVPVCGINIGTVGFLADIEPDELERKLGKILIGAYHVERRLMLSAQIISETGERWIGQAINDIIVTKNGVARMVDIDLSINAIPFAEFKADGVIIATPTGSTAYSLSAGGPMMNPNVEALLVTPICAHSLNMRPIVIRESDIVHIGFDSMQDDIIVTMDGQESVRLARGDSLRVGKSRLYADIVKFEDKDYYSTIKNKLWRHS